jgi:hypothetical protein
MGRRVFVECPGCGITFTAMLEGAEGSVVCKCGQQFGVVTALAAFDLSVKPEMKGKKAAHRPKMHEDRSRASVPVMMTDMQKHLLDTMAQSLGKKDGKQLIREMARELVKDFFWPDGDAVVVEDTNFKLVVSQRNGLSFQIWRQPALTEDEPILSVGDFGVQAYHNVPQVVLELAQALEDRWAKAGGSGFVTEEDIRKISIALGLTVPKVRRTAA